MNSITKNILAVVVGAIVGSLINMGLVNLGPYVIALPEGADISSTESLQASIDLFKPSNFLFPFLGHALGCLVGAFLAAKLAANHNMKFALGIGVFFLIGGITAFSMIGGPVWFAVVDLVLAYIPMGYLGGILARSGKSKRIEEATV
ncbi:MAG: hypothetical protein KTR29_10905 [Rhodothermaceae bacterium]|nr:hypothetical protein [Rhodothermaceae bacterium]